MNCSVLALILSVFFIQSIRCQSLITGAAAVDSALKKNPRIMSFHKELERQQALQKGSLSLEKTDIWFEAPNGSRFALGIQQYFHFPTLYYHQLRMQKGQVTLAQKDLHLNAASLTRDVLLIYLEIQYVEARLAQLRSVDSIYDQFYRADEKKQHQKELEQLEHLLEESKHFELTNRIYQLNKEVQSYRYQLLLLTGIRADTFLVESLSKHETDRYLPEDTSFLEQNPQLGAYSQSLKISHDLLKVQKANALPGLFAGYLNQAQGDGEILYRFRFGISLPLWLPAYTSKIKSARIGIDIASHQYKAIELSVKAEYRNALLDLEKSRSTMTYLENRALKHAEEIITTATKLYGLGQISYFNYLTGMTQAMEIKLQYLHALKEFNASVIQLRYLKGE